MSKNGLEDYDVEYDSPKITSTSSLGRRRLRVPVATGTTRPSLSLSIGGHVCDDRVTKKRLVKFH